MEGFGLAEQTIKTKTVYLSDIVSVTIYNDTDVLVPNHDWQNLTD